MILNLSNKVFELIENSDALAAKKTRMVFEKATSSYRATDIGEMLRMVILLSPLITVR